MSDQPRSGGHEPIGVLISGHGSNLQALMRAISEGRLGAEIRVVISNVAGAGGLALAKAANIEALEMPHRAYPSRERYDAALVQALNARGVRWVCLAGFMRLLGPEFCRAFPNRVLNIHPSLLPAFAGVNAQQQALLYGVKVSGATVHLVTPELDAGPVVEQRTVPVEAGDTVETLSARILAVEHDLYPAALQRMLHSTWRIVGRRVLFD